MKRAFGYGSAILFGSCLLSGEARAGNLRVLSSTDTEVVVEWTSDETKWQTVGGDRDVYRRPICPGGLYLASPGEADVPSLIHLVAAPSGSEPRVHIVDVSSESMAVPDMAPAAKDEIEVDEFGRVEVTSSRSSGSTERVTGMSPTAWAEIAGTSQVRGNRLARLVLHPWRYDAARRELHAARRLVVRVDWGRGESEASFRPRRESSDWRNALQSSVLNPGFAQAFRASSAPPASAPRGSGDSFASSSNWLKVEFTTAGMYQIDYFTFTNLGFDPGLIDPSTIRVFSGRSMPLVESLQTPRDSFMFEHALLDLGNGDAQLDVNDRLLFYMLGPSGWSAEYDSTLSRTVHLENPYTDETAAWITWGGSFASPARRMAGRDVAPDPMAPQFATFAPHRVHFEQNNLDNFRFRDEDGWWWESLRGRGDNRRYDIPLQKVANGQGSLTARVASVEGSERYRRVQLKLGGVVLRDSTWLDSSNAALVELRGTSSGFFEGVNGVFLNAVSQTAPVPTVDQVLVGWFEVEYNRRLEAYGGKSLHFFADPVGGVDDFQLSGFDADPTTIFLFDVTDPHAPVRLSGYELTQVAPPHGILFTAPNPGSTTRWYLATTLEGVLTLPKPEVVTPRGLRSPANGAEYLIVHHPRFENAAHRLAQIRSTWGPHPRSTKVVAVGEIYDEFSWGMVDPTAIRDFFAYAIESWNDDAPLFAVLIGDAAYDQKGFLSGSPENLVPSYLNRYQQASTRRAPVDNVNFFSTDDFFGYLEPEDYASAFLQPGLDMAIGRYPISDAGTIDLMLDKLEAYLAETQPGSWQNRILLVADDERTLDENTRERYHTEQVETLAEGSMPPSLDLIKLYLTEYPRNDFNKKPEAQEKFIEEFSRGALMVSYTGHGDQNTMAQEEVFVSQKVSDLRNEEKYSIFSTFSCTVSRFDLLSGSSMCELFLSHLGGGSVTTFASGALVYPNPSATLHQRWISTLFGTPYVVGTYSRQVLPLGIAALIAKTITSENNSETRLNNEKYVLLGDPALEVRFGETAIEFDRPTVETPATEGLLRVIRGSVVDAHGNPLDGTNGTPAFRGTGYVYVTENADTTGYDYEIPIVDINGNVTGTIPANIPYVLDGPVAYRGEVPIENGRFETKFYLSEATPSGNHARVSVFAVEDGLDRDASGAFDSLAIAPTISPGQVSDAEGPAIRIGFEGFAEFSDGDFLNTDRPVVSIGLEDPSGINLRSFPQFARLEMEIDGLSRLSLADDFSYGSGSFTQGTVRRALTLSPGDHSIEVKAFDNVGNKTSARARFTIVTGSADFDLVDAEITPYPNPFRDEVDFVFRLTRAADVALKVFTVSGRRVYMNNTIAGQAGENVVHWDGRDEGGGLLANGTYLYKLDAAFRDTDGSMTKDQFVGRVVKMR